MKLLSFLADPQSSPRVGAMIDGSSLVDLTTRLSTRPASMIDLMLHWDTVADEARKIVDQGHADHELATVVQLSPVPRPGKLLGIGLNYADHVRETGHELPAEQIWFAKMPTCVTGPLSPIELPRVSEQLDYEAELAVVIGRRCRHVSREQAPGVIFGYCVANDVSVRDWQRRTSQYILGKSFDTHAPLGPWIVTADELGNPHELDIRCIVNGEERQRSNTRELIFDCFDQVALLSLAMTLEPGDVLLSGTPGGVGAAFKPPRWLRAGDVVRVEIERIGAIENVVTPEAG